MLRDEAGSALIELALTLPLFTLIIIGAAELGRIAYASVEVSEAARAAVAYGAQNHITAGDTAGITQAAKSSAADIISTSLSVTPSNACVCETINTGTGQTTNTAITTCGGTGSTALTQCPTSTTNGQVNEIVTYVQATTQATVTTMFHYPGIPTSFTLSGFAEMRVLQD
jgi:Flp pilus assembly protein TadG